MKLTFIIFCTELNIIICNMSHHTHDTYRQAEVKVPVGRRPALPVGPSEGEEFLHVRRWFQCLLREVVLVPENTQRT